jgi:hypothetical protein
MDSKQAATGPANRLRELARQRADGKLTQEQFREQRRRFINDVTAGRRFLNSDLVGDATVRGYRKRQNKFINFPILLATACVIALLTLVSLYLIRDTVLADDREESEFIATDS